jgi:hypothetical protein
VKTPVILALLISIALPRFLPAEPLRLESGEPLVGIYYFTHWWEPWKSDDDRIRADLRRLRDMGFNTVFLDQEPSQMYDGEWAILDRDFRLARETGMKILPWLEAKCGKDASMHSRFEQVKRRWGAELSFAERQDGKESQVLVWEPAFTDYMVGWISDYLERYSDTGTILTVVGDGETHRVISPCVEIGWEMVSFDDETNRMFRSWLRRKYDGVRELNAAWGTDFKGIMDVDPRDTDVFDYSDLWQETQSPAVTDHVEFRAEVCRDALQKVCDRLREKYPDLLFVAELPHEIGHQHPNSIKYTWEYAAVPTMAEWGDILLIRSGGFPDPRSVDLMDAFTERTGIPIIYTHRISATQGPGRGEFSNEMAREYAEQAAMHGVGFGYYSWNEMVDVHMSRNYPSTVVPEGAQRMSRTEEEEQWLSARVARINQAYLDIVGLH